MTRKEVFEHLREIGSNVDSFAFRREGVVRHIHDAPQSVEGVGVLSEVVSVNCGSYSILVETKAIKSIKEEKIIEGGGTVVFEMGAKEE